MVHSVGLTLDSAVVLEEVRQCTGLADIDTSGGLTDRLDTLLRFLDQDAQLDQRGKKAAFETVVKLLSARSLAMSDRVRYPEIAQEVVERPIFVAGMGRSGTTLMHSLLGAMPGNRSPLQWEVSRPSPPLGISDPGDRITLADDEVRGLWAQNPQLPKAHPYHDRLSHTPVECSAFESLDVRIMHPLFYFNVPTVPAADLRGDSVDLYRFEHAMLQNLQWKREKRRWALKGVHHHARLDALKEVFPDSVVIWLHRDPRKVVASMIFMLTNSFQNYAGKEIDKKYWAGVLFCLIKQDIDAALASKQVEGPGVHNVLYADFVRDPVGQIRHVYEQADMPFERGSEEAIRGWLDDPANKGDRYGKFVYSLEPLGITEDQIEDALGEYRARFNIPFE